MRKLWFVLILVFILVLSVFVISAKESKSDKIEKKIVDELQNQEKVKVIVKMRNNGNGKIQTASDKKAERVLAINAVGEEKVNHEFSSFNGFSAKLNEAEIEILKNNANVESVYYDYPMYIDLQDSVGIINANITWPLQVSGLNLTGQGQTICIIDTGVDYTHPDLGNCSLTTLSTIGNNESYVLENTPHPYANNYNYIWNITRPGFSQIAVHFVNISTEQNFDHVKIYDANKSLIAVYSGSKTNLWTPSSLGDTIYISLGSDESVTDYGFYVDYVLNGTVNTSYSWSNCTKVIGGWDIRNSDPDPKDDQGHGTHVAGIAAANGLIKGVAPGAKIVAVKVMNNAVLASGTSSDIIAGIEWCTNRSSDYNISVISMSLGGELYSSYCDNQPNVTIFANPINAAVAKNISVIVAAGNDGESTYISAPACIQNATPVGATNKSDVIASYSNRNELVQLFAPGSSINSTATSGPSSCAGTGYKSCSGTSMATPHVAGAFAIVNQFLKANGKTRTPQEIESIFNATGKIVYDASSGSNFSRINVYDAIMSIDITPPNVSLISPAEGYSPTGTTTVLFEYNVTESSNISNCALILNGAISAYNSSEIINSTNNISSSLSAGSYNWSINCTDLAGNIGNSSSKSLTINSAPPSSGGGGGTTAKIYEATSAALSEGYNTALKKGDKIEFQSNSGSHTLTTNNIGTNFVNVTIQSNPINIKLAVGESKELNLSSADYYDLNITLVSIKSGKANITLKSIYEKMIIEETVKPAPEANKTEITNTINGNIINETTSEKKGILSWSLYAMVFIALGLILFAISWLIKNRMLRKKGRVNLVSFK